MRRAVGLVSLGLLAVVVSSACSSDDSVADSQHGGATGMDASGGAGGTSGWSGSAGAGATGGAASGGTAGAASGGSAGGGAGGSTGGTGGSAGGGAGGTTGGSCGVGGSGTGSGPCEFPQGVPDPDFIASACTYQDTDPNVDAAVNAAMVELTGCGVLSDCDITGLPGNNADEVCQSWFAAVTAKLRSQGYCAGQHAVGSTDEIAVSNTGCNGKWYGYHICNYGGPKVVWNPGARRGWWMIDPSYCP